ncbi:MAG: aminomethyltransferase family protein, partial [Woeseia sp.]
MAAGTALHERTSALCHSNDWRQWSGFLVASTYNDFSQPEYSAIRHAAAAIDVSPLYKYWVTGPDAQLLTNRVFVQDTAKMDVGQVVYTPWCDNDGSVRQEGTVFRLGDDAYQVCAAEQAIGWLTRNALGLDVTIRDRTDDFAAVALQGPNSRDVLRAVSSAPVDDLKFFRFTVGEIAGASVMVSRTGYTGDLGYEIWIPQEKALDVWDALVEGGEPYHITPCGLAAMDIARIEAGFVLIGVDYVSSETAKLPHHRVSPYELGLGWSVKLDKGPNFVGRSALVKRKDERGRRVVGLEIGWEALEELYLRAGLMPDLPLAPCREPVPVYNRSGGQIGRVTTRVWSTMLKKYIGLATVDSAYAEPGTEVAMEVTVDYA